MSQRQFALDAKYTQTEGTILLSGVQALVRLPLDQQRADRRSGTKQRIEGCGPALPAPFDTRSALLRVLTAPEALRATQGANRS
jgi:indolepyruvate ferredoxin oxidoreductase